MHGHIHQVTQHNIYIYVFQYELLKNRKYYKYTTILNNKQHGDFIIKLQFALRCNDETLPIAPVHLLRKLWGYNS